MIRFFLFWLSCGLIMAETGLAQESCHPQCSWECDNPVCAAECEPVCQETLCQETQCENPDCECSSFSDLETINCTALPNACPLCEVGRVGIDCRDSLNQSCTCNLRCQTKDCDVVCEKPACPKPKCGLSCEESSCLIMTSQDEGGSTDFITPD